MLGLDPTRILDPRPEGVGVPPAIGPASPLGGGSSSCSPQAGPGLSTSPRPAAQTSLVGGGQCLRSGLRASTPHADNCFPASGEKPEPSAPQPGSPGGDWGRDLTGPAPLGSVPPRKVRCVGAEAGIAEPGHKGQSQSGAGAPSRAGVSAGVRARAG